MKILICGAKDSGKTTIAKPLAKELGAEYIRCGKLYTIKDFVAEGKTVIIDKRCENNRKIEKLDPDYVIWMDQTKDKIDTPYQVDHRITKRFDSVDQQVTNIVKNFKRSYR
jgi:cytidylate kinase